MCLSAGAFSSADRFLHTNKSQRVNDSPHRRAKPQTTALLGSCCAALRLNYQVLIILCLGIVREITCLSLFTLANRPLLARFARNFS